MLDGIEFPVPLLLLLIDEEGPANSDDNEGALIFVCRSCAIGPNRDAVGELRRPDAYSGVVLGAAGDVCIDGSGIVTRDPEIPVCSFNS